MKFNRIVFTSPTKDETNKSRNFEILKTRIRHASLSSESNSSIYNNNINSRLNTNNNNTNCKMVAAILQRKRDDLFVSKSSTTSSMFFTSIAPKRPLLAAPDKRSASVDLSSSSSSTFVDISCNNTTTSNKQLINPINNLSFFNRMFNGSKINKAQNFKRDLFDSNSNVRTRLEAKENTLSKSNLIKLVNSVDDSSKLEEEVSKVLIDFTDEYVENIISRCVSVCRHRNSKTLTQKDVAFVLNINVPPPLNSENICSNQIKFDENNLIESSECCSQENV